jgi:hypothetical protein
MVELWDLSLYCGLDGSAKEEDLMTEPRHGRYYAQDWHLVGVSDVPGEGGVMLFWDTARASFGRTTG